MKITDMLNSYEDTAIQLPPAEDVSLQRVKGLVQQKLPPQLTRRRRGRTVLLAAAALVMVCSTVFAISMSLWDRAREDLGLAPDKTLPEYVEYDLKSSVAETPTVSLVSALWTNTQSTIYLRVENPIKEMTSEQQDSHWSPWEVGSFSFAPSDAQFDTCWIEQVAYDEQENAVLLRCNLSVKNLAAAETCSFQLQWAPSDWLETNEPLDLGLVTVEIPRLRQLQATVNVPYDNPYLDIQGTVAAFDFYANSFRVTMEVPAFEEACEMLGEGATGTIAAAYWNTWAEEPDNPDEFTELDAIVAYDRSWRNPWDDFTLIYKDGTEVTFDALAYQAAALFDEEAGYSFGYELCNPVDLDQLKSVSYHGTEFLLEPID